MTTPNSDDRKIMVQNLLNGVSVQQVAQAFHKDERFVNELFSYAMVKIRSYLFERSMPPVPCATLEDAHKNRFTVLGYLDKINLDRRPKFHKVDYLVVDSDNIFDIRTGR